jgi:hypothetical protein
LGKILEQLKDLGILQLIDTLLLCAEQSRQRIENRKQLLAFRCGRSDGRQSLLDQIQCHADVDESRFALSRFGLRRRHRRLERLICLLWSFIIWRRRLYGRRCAAAFSAGYDRHNFFFTRHHGPLCALRCLHRNEKVKGEYVSAPSPLAEKAM